METSKLVLYGVSCFINSVALFFIVWYICTAYKKMKDDLNHVVDYLKYVSDRNDLVYLNQLQDLIYKLAKQERYEEADRVKKLFDKELNRLNNRS